MSINANHGYTFRHEGTNNPPPLWLQIIGSICFTVVVLVYVGWGWTVLLARKMFKQPRKDQK